MIAETPLDHPDTIDIPSGSSQVALGRRVTERTNPLFVAALWKHRMTEMNVKLQPQIQARPTTGASSLSSDYGARQGESIR